MAEPSYEPCGRDAHHYPHVSSLRPLQVLPFDPAEGVVVDLARFEPVVCPGSGSDAMDVPRSDLAAGLTPEARYAARYGDRPPGERDEFEALVARRDTLRANRPLTHRCRFCQAEIHPVPDPVRSTVWHDSNDSGRCTDNPPDGPVHLPFWCYCGGPSDGPGHPVGTGRYCRA